MKPLKSLDGWATLEDAGTHFVSNRTCVSCGKIIEYAKREDGSPGYANHKCDDRHEASKKGANTRGQEPLIRGELFGERLRARFSAMRGNQ